MSINKTEIEYLIHQWLGFNPEIDWDNCDMYAKTLENMLGPTAHAVGLRTHPGTFQIVFIGDNGRADAVCEVYAQTETIKWLQ